MYRVRQSFIFEGRYLNYNQMDKLRTACFLPSLEGMGCPQAEVL